MTIRTSLLALLPAVAFLSAACGDKDGGDGNAAELVGTYSGAISSPVVKLNYSVTVTEVDSDTIAVSGADFTSFEVELMGAAGFVTSLVDDEANELAYVDGLLDITHDGAESVVYSGNKDSDGGPAAD